VASSQDIRLAGMVRKPQDGEVRGGAGWVVDAGQDDFVDELRGALVLYET